MEISLRPWTLEDIPNLIVLGDNPKIAQYMTDQFPHPYTVEKAKAFIGFATSGTPNHILAIDLAGQAVGGIGIHQQPDIHCKNAELGYWLGEPYWGQGIMTQAIGKMVEYGFANWEVTRIFARPFGTNIGSQKALEKAGFILEGRFEKTLFKNGVFLDELIYAIRRTS